MIERADLIARLQELDNSLGEIYEPHEQFPPALVGLFNQLLFHAKMLHEHDPMWDHIRTIEVFMGKTIDTVNEAYSRFVGVVRVEIGQMVVVLERDLQNESQPIG